MKANSSVPPAQMLDLDQLKAATVSEVPFPFLILPGFVRAEARAGVTADFPDVARAGSFPLSSLNYGPAFEAFVEALSSREVGEIVEEKFAVDLKDRPTMATVRGRCEARDGHIHTDSKSKLITLLLYMNDHPNADEGRLRLLRSPTDLDDVAAEVPADEGTLVIFKNGPKAWHGFEPFSGPRRVIQVNWVTGGGVVKWEQTRHRISAFFKRLFAGTSAGHAAQH